MQKADEQMSYYRDLLKEKGLRATPVRISVLKIFNESRIPVDANTIFAKQKGADEVTIYRTLTTLEKFGIIKRVDLRKGSVHFELNIHHHHHIICTNCNTIEDFADPGVERAIEKIWRQATRRSPNFKSINEHSLELFGLCMKCV